MLVWSDRGTLRNGRGGVSPPCARPRWVGTRLCGCGKSATRVWGQVDCPRPRLWRQDPAEARTRRRPLLPAPSLCPWARDPPPRPGLRVPVRPSREQPSARAAVLQPRLCVARPQASPGEAPRGGEPLSSLQKERARSWRCHNRTGLRAPPVYRGRANTAGPWQRAQGASCLRAPPHPRPWLSPLTPSRLGPAATPHPAHPRPGSPPLRAQGRPPGGDLLLRPGVRPP